MRATKPVFARLVGIWQSNSSEPWILATDLDTLFFEVLRLYKKRFQIEETFRDKKCVRSGLHLGELKMRRARRLEKMLLICALVELVEWLAMTVGEMAKGAGLDRRYSVNTKPQAYSDFTLGLYYCTRWRWELFLALKIARKLAESINPKLKEQEKWG